MIPDTSHFTRIPLAEITSPEKLGPLWVYRDHWWAVTEDDHVLICTHRGANSPQCNTNRIIVERYLSYPEPITTKFLPWAYHKFNLSEYT